MWNNGPILMLAGAAMIAAGGYFGNEVSKTKRHQDTFAFKITNWCEVTKPGVIVEKGLCQVAALHINPDPFEIGNSRFQRVQ